MKRKSTFWLVVLCVVLFSLTASRQVYVQAETGAIDRTVTDATGAVIPSGKVVVRSLATGAERIASTNDRGYYSVSNLLPGLYWVVAEAPNLAKSERRVEVTVGSRNEVNLQLALGTTSTIVEVVGEGGLQVNTETATLSTVIDSQQIQQLPTVNRDPYAFALYVWTLPCRHEWPQRIPRPRLLEHQFGNLQVILPLGAVYDAVPRRALQRV